MEKKGHPRDQPNLGTCWCLGYQHTGGPGTNPHPGGQRAQAAPLWLLAAARLWHCCPCPCHVHRDSPAPPPAAHHAGSVLAPTKLWSLLQVLLTGGPSCVCPGVAGQFYSAHPKICCFFFYSTFLITISCGQKPFLGSTVSHGGPSANVRNGTFSSHQTFSPELF